MELYNVLRMGFAPSYKSETSFSQNALPETNLPCEKPTAPRSRAMTSEKLVRASRP